MPNDLYDDMRRLNALYEELMWSNDDDLQFMIENGRIVILNIIRKVNYRHMLTSYLTYYNPR